MVEQNRDVRVNFGDPKPETLESSREGIEQIDRQILELLAQRFGLVQKIGDLKKESGWPIEDLTREAHLRSKYEQWVQELGLDAMVVKKIFQLIFEEAKKKQSSV